MKKDEVVIAVLETTTPGKKIEIRVDYDRGGMNYFQGVTMQRGYWLSVTPFEQGEHSRTIAAFSGTTAFMEPASRFNARRIAERAEQLKKNMKTHDLLQKTLAHVLQKNNLVLKETSHAQVAQG